MIRLFKMMLTRLYHRDLMSVRQTVLAQGAQGYDPWRILGVILDRCQASCSDKERVNLMTKRPSNPSEATQGTSQSGDAVRGN